MKVDKLEVKVLAIKSFRQDKTLKESNYNKNVIVPQQNASADKNSSVFKNLKKKGAISKNALKNPQKLNKILEILNRRLNPLEKELKIEIDKDLNMPIFKIIDKRTKEVLRQVPLEEIVKFLKGFEKFLKLEQIKEEDLKGLLFKKEV